MSAGDNQNLRGNADIIANGNLSERINMGLSEDERVVPDENVFVVLDINMFFYFAFLSTVQAKQSRYIRSYIRIGKTVVRRKIYNKIDKCRIKALQISYQLMLQRHFASL
jgi:hypothetical protein